MYPTRHQVDNFFNQLGYRWILVITELDKTVEYELSKGQRKVVYRWDPRNPEEMWFVFGNGSEWDFEDWTEMFESEKQSVHFSYLEALAERYLENQTRLRRTWLLFGRSVLQFENQGSWHDIRKAV